MHTLTDVPFVAIVVDESDEPVTYYVLYANVTTCPRGMLTRLHRKILKVGLRMTVEIVQHRATTRDKNGT